MVILLSVAAVTIASPEPVKTVSVLLLAVSTSKSPVNCSASTVPRTPSTATSASPVKVKVSVLAIVAASMVTSISSPGALSVSSALTNALLLPKLIFKPALLASSPVVTMSSPANAVTFWVTSALASKSSTKPLTVTAEAPDRIKRSPSVTIPAALMITSSLAPLPTTVVVASPISISISPSLSVVAALSPVLTRKSPVNADALTSPTRSSTTTSDAPSRVSSTSSSKASAITNTSPEARLPVDTLVVAEPVTTSTPVAPFLVVTSRVPLNRKSSPSGSLARTVTFWPTSVTVTAASPLMNNVAFVTILPASIATIPLVAVIPASLEPVSIVKSASAIVSITKKPLLLPATTSPCKLVT